MDIQKLTLSAMAYRHDMPKPDANSNVTISAEFVNQLTLFIVNFAPNQRPKDKASEQ